MCGYQRLYELLCTLSDPAEPRFGYHFEVAHVFGVVAAGEHSNQSDDKQLSQNVLPASPTARTSHKSKLK